MADISAQQKLMKCRAYLEGNPTDAKLLYIFNKLLRFPVTIDILQATGIGKAVNAFRKREGEIGEKARVVVTQWKSLVSKQENSLVDKRSVSSSSSPYNSTSTEQSGKTSSDDEKTTPCQTKQQSSPQPSSKVKSSPKECDRTSENIKERKKHQSTKSNPEASRSSSSSSSSEKKKSKTASDSKSNENKEEHHRSSKSKSESESKSKAKTSQNLKQKKSSKDSLSFEDFLNYDDSSVKKKSKKRKHDRDEGSKSSKEKKESHSSSKLSREKKELDSFSKSSKEKKELDSFSKSSKEKKELDSFSKSSKEKKELDSFSKSSKEKKELDSFSKSSKEKKELDPSRASSKSHSSKSSSSSYLEISKKSSSKEPKSSTSRVLHVPSPSKELLPSESEILSSLPETQAHYHPWRLFDTNKVEQKSMTQSGDDLDSVLLGIKSRTRECVYSGKKTIIKEVPSLFSACIQVLIENIEGLEYVGGIPFHILHPVLERCTVSQLYTLEDYNPHFLEDSDKLWKIHCQRDFRGFEPDEMESWREMYLRRFDEREAKLKVVKASITASMSKVAPERTVKMAFVEAPAKPPREVRRKQLKYGTGTITKDALGPYRTYKPVVNNQLLASTAVSHPSSSAPSSGRIQVSQQHRSSKVIAPMMQKTMKMIKKMQRR